MVSNYPRGSSANEAAIGERLGPAVAKNEITKAITTILDVYVKQRLEEESFLDMVKRVGITLLRSKFMQIIKTNTSLTILGKRLLMMPLFQRVMSLFL